VHVPEGGGYEETDCFHGTPFAIWIGCADTYPAPLFLR
jgi:hypothetical protein